MKKGEFYITTNTGIQKRDGYILQTAGNVYGIHNGGSYCKNWIITDLKTGLQVRDNFRTRKAAGDFIESTPEIEERILKMHNDPNSEFINNCIKAINQAHTVNPIDNTKPRRPVKNGFYVYTYTSTSGTERAAIAPRSNPDEYFLDVYAEDLAKHIQQIIDTTPGAYFIDKTTGLDIDPAKLDTTPAPDTTPADVIPETTPAPVTAAETTPAPEESQESTTESAPETSPALYKYGMRSRGYSIAAQPAGVVAREDDPAGIYYDIICYERELTPAELDHYSLDPLQPAGDPVQAASQDATSPAIISDKETTTTPPENGSQAAREETPERLTESPRENPGTTTPPGPETVTESTTSQPEKAAATQATSPREGPTRPPKTASHTDTHERRKTRYKAKYKASRTREGPPKQSLFSKVS